MESNPKLTIGWIGTGIMETQCAITFSRPITTISLNLQSNEVQVFEFSRVRSDFFRSKGNCPELRHFVPFGRIPFRNRGFHFQWKWKFKGKCKGNDWVPSTRNHCGRPHDFFSGFGEENGEGIWEEGIISLDFPVTGGDIGAMNGRLSTMVGGDVKGLEKVRWVLECYCSRIEYLEASGNGQYTKLVNQTILTNTLMESVKAFYLPGSQV